MTHSSSSDKRLSHSPHFYSSYYSSVDIDLFQRILASEEEHVDFLEKQFDMIVRMGEQNYIQLQSAAAGEEGNEGGAWGLGGGDGNGN